LKPQTAGGKKQSTVSELLYQDLGSTDYLTALALQEQFVVAKQQNSSPDILLFVEHPHVYTLGRGGNEANVLAPDDVPVIWTSPRRRCNLSRARANWLFIQSSICARSCEKTCIATSETSNWRRSRPCKTRFE
jgi:hypothetical protein